jgi:hypothetical protein
MDVERIKAEMLALEQWVDDDRPPLLGLVVLADGGGLAVSYPFLEVAARTGREDRRAALMLIRLFLGDFAARIDTELTELERTFLDIPSERDR